MGIASTLGWYLLIGQGELVSSQSGGLAGASVGKNPSANVGDAGFIPGLGRSPGGGNGNPLQYSYLENPMDRGAGRAIAHGVAKESDMTEWVNNNKASGVGEISGN